MLLNIAVCINSICNSIDVFQLLNRPIVNTFYIILNEIISIACFRPIFSLSKNNGSYFLPPCIFVIAFSCLNGMQSMTILTILQVLYKNSCVRHCSGLSTEYYLLFYFKLSSFNCFILLSAKNGSKDTFVG